MPFSNYTDLQTSVANWMHRDDLAAQIPDIVGMAEFWLARDLRIAPLIAQGSVPIDATTSAGPLPDNCMEIVSASIAGNKELKYMPPDTYDRAVASANSVHVPLYYTRTGDNLKVAPMWNDGGTVTVVYFGKQPAMSGAVPSNWYLENAPDLLLYACLLIASPYLKDADSAAMWKEYYANGVKTLNDQYGVLDGYQRMVAMNSGSGKALQPSS